MTPPVQVRGLEHVYDREPVLSVPELALAPGTWHLAGSNGAGKTTLLRILATLTRPTRGDVTVAGHRLPGEARRARARLGYAGHEPSLHEASSTRGALQVHADLHDVPDHRVDAALETWDLADRAGRRVSRLSFGQRRRVDLARALLHAPDVVLLDEPARGLDEAALVTLSDLLDAHDPEIVLVASPDEPPVPVDGRIRLADGRIEEAPS